MQRSFWPLLLATLLLTIAALLREGTAEERLETAARALQARVERARPDLQLAADIALKRLTSKNNDSCWQELARFANRDPDAGIEYDLFREDSLIAWSGSAPILLNARSAGSTLKSFDGLFLHASATQGGLSVHVLRRVWYEPPFENRYLHKRFPAWLGVPAGIEASMSPGMGAVVRDRTGPVLFRLQWRDDLALPSTRTTTRLWLVCFAFLLVLGSSWRALHRVIRDRPWRTILLLFLGLLAIRAMSLQWGPWSWLNSSALFDPSLFATSFFWLPSLGDLLIHAVLLLFFAAFARSAMRGARAPTRPPLVALIGALLLMAFATGLNVTLVALVRDSHIPLDLFHVQEFNAYSVITLCIVAALLLSWALLADALVRWTSPAWKNAWALVLLALMGAQVGMNHLLGEYDSVLVLWPVPVLAAILLMYLDKQRITYWILLVAGFAFYTVHMLNRQSLKRLERERDALAESSITREDPVIELLFREAGRAIRNDPDADALLSNDSIPVNAAELDARLRRTFFNGPWENYDVRLYLFRSDGTLLGTTSPDDGPSLTRLRARFEQGIPVSDDRSLRNTHRASESALYIGVFPASTGTNELFIELFPRAQPEGLGFPELLLAGERNDELRSGHYRHARYERGVLMESSTNAAFPAKWSLPVPIDGLRYDSGDMDVLVTGEVNGTLTAWGLPTPTWLEHATTFSYLFVLFSLLAGLWSLFDLRFREGRLPVLDITGKLRTGILLFAGLALLLFAFGSQQLLRSHYLQHTDELLEERMRSATADLRQHLHAESFIAPAQVRDLDHWVDDASSVLLTDLSFYSPTGALLATSREQVFNSGLLGTRMDPEAYRHLAIEGQSRFAQAERIGDAVFRTAYRPFRNDRGQVLGYLALPYFARQSEVEQERTTGYVAIVNLFVLLFVLSVIAAALIATWTTRPLQLLKRGLEHIQLGARNEPIVYDGHDELGELVRVYNRKVEELRDSADRLARSERESAWREMARQVAHEIKNPLTPMKLSIQHFQHSWDPQAPDAKQRLDKLSTGLVQQIDALSGVASAFSQFAQMPSVQLVDLDLREVAEAAVSLFASEPNAEVHLSAPSSQHVQADREHLLRVLNNLIKNALQAIPDGRHGHVEVLLRAEGQEAIIEVRDNGSGIPEEIRERIFTPSFTTKSSGMGLGLAMVKRMVEQAGGRVWFTTEVGVGTSFFVALALHRFDHAG